MDAARQRWRNGPPISLTRRVLPVLLLAGLAAAPSAKMRAQAAPRPVAMLPGPKLDPLFRAQLLAASARREGRSPGGARPGPGPFAVLAGGASPLAVLPPDSLLSGILEFRGSVPELAAMGVHVRTNAGDLSTVRVRAADLERLLADPRAIRFEADRPGGATLHQSGLIIGSPSMHAPRPAYPGGVQGQGVLVGLLDSGIDWRHPDFSSASGRNRIRAVWDQYGSLHPPPGFDYGTLWSEADIAAGLPDEADFFGHGTLVAGIAAGSGLATGHGYPAFYEVGVAPEADIAAVKTTYLSGFTSQTSSWIDGLKFLFDLAASRGEDAVVNLSYGGQWGSHDGATLTERMLSALTGPGRILVVSAGNDAQKGLHASFDCAAGDTAAVQVSIPAYVPSPTPDGDFVLLEGWGSVPNAGSVEVVVPTLPPGVAGPVSPGSGGIFEFGSGDVGIFVGNPTMLPDPEPSQASFMVQLGGLGQDRPVPGPWTIRFMSPGRAVHCDLWIDAPYFSGILPNPTFVASDSTRTLAAPGTCDSCITVGSFVTMDSWPDSLGGQDTYASRGITSRAVGGLSDFSSRGPRRDGVPRPDLAAPGQGIASSLSRDSRIVPWRVFADGQHAVFEGTSLAAPQVTGAIALLLQIQPHLPPARVRDILRRASVTDDFVRSGSQGDWGAGKLNVANLFEAVAATDFGPASHALRIGHSPNPSSGAVTFDVFAGRPQLSARLEVFDAAGRRVLLRDLGAIGAGHTALAWPLGDARPRPAAGVYFAKLSAGGGTAFDRLVLVR